MVFTASQLADVDDCGARVFSQGAKHTHLDEELEELGQDVGEGRAAVSPEQLQAKEMSPQISNHM